MRAQLKAFYKFLNTQLGLVIISFILITFAGGIINELFNRNAWERSKKFEILRLKIDEGQKSLEEISNLINLRFFRLNRVFENTLAEDLTCAERSWKEYIDIEEQWNVKLKSNQNKLARLVSKEIAQEFNSYLADKPKLSRTPSASSIHGKFYLAHN